MKRLIVAGAAMAVLVSAIAGYRIGAGSWPGFNSKHVDAPNPQERGSSGNQRIILYWKHPDGDADFSPTPKKTADGRNYLPVYEDQEADFKEAKAAKPKEGRKIITYRNPMGLPDTSPVPKKDWMGMDYIPVYEGEEEGSAVRVSLDRVQRSGVRTEEVQMRPLVRPIRAPGIAKPDERTLRSVTLRSDGFIEVLYVNETGKHVRAGERLFRVYSPQIVSAQIEFRIAAKSPGALQRLKNLDVPEHAINELRSNPNNPAMTIDWPAPVGGVVMEKKVVAGQMVKAGEELYRLADLSSIWVIADVAEQDIGLVTIGMPVKIGFRALPDRPFDGYVAFVLHELDARTRTGKVRIEVKNPEHIIKHEMYAEVEIDAAAGESPRLVVPTSAVIDSGTRQVVIVERGEGLFEPRPVKLGLRGDGLVEIREGLKVGEKVVVTANFLIDAESNLKAALKGFTADSTPAAKP